MSSRSLPGFFYCRNPNSHPNSPFTALIDIEAAPSDYETIQNDHLTRRPLSYWKQALLGAIATSHGTLQTLLLLKYLTWISGNERISDEHLLGLLIASISLAIPVTYYLCRRIAINLRQGLNFPSNFWQGVEQVTIFGVFASLQFGEIIEHLIENLERLTSSMSKEEIVNTAKYPIALGIIITFALIEGYGALILNGVESDRHSEGEGPHRALINVCCGKRETSALDEEDFRVLNATYKDRATELCQQINRAVMNFLAFPNHAAAGALGGFQLLHATSLLTAKETPPYALAFVAGSYALTTGVFETITQLGAVEDLKQVASNSEVEHQWFTRRNLLFLFCAFLDNISIPLGYLQFMDYLFDITDINIRIILFTWFTVMTTVSGLKPPYDFLRQIAVDEKDELPSDSTPVVIQLN